MLVLFETAYRAASPSMRLIQTISNVLETLLSCCNSKLKIGSFGSAQNPILSNPRSKVWSFSHILMAIEDALRDLLKEEFEVFRSEIRNLLKSQNEEQRYLTRKEVARYLGVALSTVDLWSRTGKLHKIKVSGSSRFDRLEIDRTFSHLKNGRS